MFTFADLVEEVRKLDDEEIQELQLIIHRERIEKARKGFLKNLKKAKLEEKEGKLKFSADIDSLKKQLRVK
jgi:hypothetical protein